MSSGDFDPEVVADRLDPGHRRLLGGDMTSRLITNIAELVTWDDDQPIRSDAALVVEDGVVAWVGPELRRPGGRLRPGRRRPLR